MRRSAHGLAGGRLRDPGFVRNIDMTVVGDERLLDVKKAGVVRGVPRCRSWSRRRVLREARGQRGKATLQTEVLARTLGVTTQEASALKIALGDIGVGTDDYSTMVGKLTVKLRDNEERFNALGVVTRERTASCSRPRRSSRTRSRRSTSYRRHRPQSSLHGALRARLGEV